MPITYEYDGEKNIVYSYTTGVVNMPELAEYFKNVAEDPKVEKDFIEIANLDGVEEFNFSYSDTLQLPDLFAEIINQKNQRGTIFVAKKDFQFGMARMMSIVVEGSLPTRVVRTQEEAEKEVISLRG